MHTKIKTRNFLLKALRPFTQKFAPTNISHYMVYQSLSKHPVPRCDVHMQRMMSVQKAHWGPYNFWQPNANYLLSSKLTGKCHRMFTEVLRRRQLFEHIMHSIPILSRSTHLHTKYGTNVLTIFFPACLLL